MKGKGKGADRSAAAAAAAASEKNLDPKDCPLKYPDLDPVDHSKDCPRYTSGIVISQKNLFRFCHDIV